MKKLIILFLLVVVEITALELPDDIKICKPNDLEINKCISEGIKTALKVFAKGNKELNMFPLDPLKIDRINMYDNSKAVALPHELLNLTIHGLSNITQISVKNFNFTSDLFSFFVEVLVPHLDLTGNYKLNGKILLLPIYGEDKCKIALSNMLLTFNIIGETYEKNGEKYARWKKINCRIKKLDIKLHFENLLGGDPRLGEEMNKLLNDNIQDIFSEFKPAYEKFFKSIVGKSFNIIFGKILLRKLLILE